MHFRSLIVRSFIAGFLLVVAVVAQQPDEFDVLIKNGTVYDGTGSKSRRADMLIRGDKIVAIGSFKRAKAKNVIDARGLAVAPGFINMLSHSYNSMLTDSRSL